jgi:hypothetical protein
MFARFLSFLIQTWLRITGRTVSLAEYPWLDGPIGTNYIGEEFYGNYAKSKGWNYEVATETGVMVDFRELGSEDHPQLKKSVRDFYEKTAQYQMEIWSKAYSPMKLFAKLIIRPISKEINQLAVPLDPMEASRGITNDIIRLFDAQNRTQVVCWHRKSPVTNRVVYSGFYSEVKIKGKPYVRAVYPLPKGNATVLLRPEFLPDGSFRLVSDKMKFGGPGYYRVLSRGAGKVKVRLVPIHESIHVYEDEKGVLRTDHLFRFWGMKFLKLHYKMTLLKTNSA